LPGPKDARHANQQYGRRPFRAHPQTFGQLHAR
jgi:hypothetical protein